MKAERLPGNPILKPIPDHGWESLATFNGCVVKVGGLYRMLYRAMSYPRTHLGAYLPVSFIGYAESEDGLHFSGRRLFFGPEQEWEAFGCEDPRVTFLDGKYYVFYTALSAFPFRPQGIRVGLAISRDLLTVDEKHLVTPFNAKAMALFPQRIGGKLVAVLTVNTDLPPAKICLAFFDREEELWDLDRWQAWYESLDTHVLPLMRSSVDQVEVGAPPVLVEGGWLLIYSYIKGYLRGDRTFGIEAVLLDQEDPFRVRGRTTEPILVPEAYYERIGHVMDVVFPSGAVVNGDELLIYYGAADTTVAVAKVSLPKLLAEMRPPSFLVPSPTRGDWPSLVRYEGNPILSPRPELGWEAKSVFNPGVVVAGGRVHMLYRALSHDNTSVIGYASSSDGIYFDDQPTVPAYRPRASFEQKASPDVPSGCEDPRLTLLDGRVYMLYTAFDGYQARVAATSIPLDDFLAKRWDRWEWPIVISAPEVWDKNAALLPRRIKGKLVVFHRLSLGIWVDWLDSLEEAQEHWLGGKVILTPRKGMWDNRKVGIAAPPIETEYGWLILYHGIEEPGTIYRVGAALLDLDDPTRVLARSRRPLLEPEMEWERHGLVPNVVFPCGIAVLGDDLYVYYGGADHVIGVAGVKLKALVEALLREGREG